METNRDRQGQKAPAEEEGRGFTTFEHQPELTLGRRRREGEGRRDGWKEGGSKGEARGAEGERVAPSSCGYAQAAQPGE